MDTDILRFPQEQEPQEGINYYWVELFTQSYNDNFLTQEALDRLLFSISEAEKRGQTFAVRGVYGVQPNGDIFIVPLEVGSLTEETTRFYNFDEFNQQELQTLAAIATLNQQDYAFLEQGLLLPTIHRGEGSLFIGHGNSINTQEEWFTETNAFLEEQFLNELTRLIQENDLCIFAGPYDRSITVEPFTFTTQSGTDIEFCQVKSSTSERMGGIILMNTSMAANVADVRSFVIDTSRPQDIVVQQGRIILPIDSRLRSLGTLDPTIISGLEMPEGSEIVVPEANTTSNDKLDASAIVGLGMIFLVAAGGTYFGAKRWLAERSKPKKPKPVKKTFDPDQNREIPIKVTIDEMVQVNGDTFTFDEALILSSSEKGKLGAALGDSLLSYLRQKPDEVLQRVGLTLQELNSEHTELAAQVKSFGNGMKELSKEINALRSLRRNIEAPADLQDLEESIYELQNQHAQLETQRNAPQRRKDLIERVREIVGAVEERSLLLIENESSAKLILAFLQQRAQIQAEVRDSQEEDSGQN